MLRRKLRLLGCLLLAAPSAFAADGNELNAFGAIQRSLAGAGAAHAFDSSWLMLNPAAMTELSPRLDLYFEVMRTDAFVTPRGLPIAANNLAGRMDYRTHYFVPSFSALHHVGNGMVGFGAFAAQGNRVDYPEPFSSLGRLGNGSRRSEYAVVKFPVAYGREVGEGWSLAVGLTPTLARYRTDSLTLRLLETRGANVWDYEVGGGFLLGAQKRFVHLRLGLAYHSRVWMGDYERYNQDLLTSSFDLPQKVHAGVAWEATERLEFLLDYKWVDWDSITQLGNRSINGGLGWRDQHVFKAGVVWQASPRWTLRAGASHGSIPFPEDSVFVNALTPGIAQTHLALGATWQLAAQHAVHLSVSHALPHTRRENGRGDLFSFAGKGTELGFTETAVLLQYSFTF